MCGVTGIVLAGGKSSRMGSDKAFLEFQGQSFIDRIISHLLPICEEVMIVGNPHKFRHFPHPVVPDKIEGLGPLGGLQSGLMRSRTDINLVLACDLPLVSGELLREMLYQHSHSECLVPLIDHRIQPLCAIYHKKILPRIEQHIKQKQLSLIDFIHVLDAGFWTVPDKYRNEFSNVNSKAEFNDLIDRHSYGSKD